MWSTIVLTTTSDYDFVPPSRLQAGTRHLELCIARSRAAPLELYIRAEFIGYSDSFKLFERAGWQHLILVYPALGPPLPPFFPSPPSFWLMSCARKGVEGPLATRPDAITAEDEVCVCAAVASMAVPAAILAWAWVSSARWVSESGAGTAAAVCRVETASTTGAASTAGDADSAVELMAGDAMANIDFTRCRFGLIFVLLNYALQVIFHGSL